MKGKTKKQIKEKIKELEMIPSGMKITLRDNEDIENWSAWNALKWVLGE